MFEGLVRSEVNSVPVDFESEQTIGVRPVEFEPGAARKDHEVMVGEGRESPFDQELAEGTLGHGVGHGCAEGAIGKDRPQHTRPVAARRPMRSSTDSSSANVTTLFANHCSITR